MFHIKKLSKNELKDAHFIISEAGKDMAKTKSFFNWFPPPVTLEYMEKNINNMDVYGIYKKTNIVGTFTILNYENKPGYYSKDQWKDNNTEKAVYLKRLAILPTEQGQGIGKICLEYIEKEYPKHWIRMDVISQNTGVIKMYEKMGYEKRGESVTKNPSGDWNVICFEKISKL